MKHNDLGVTTTLSDDNVSKGSINIEFVGMLDEVDAYLSSLSFTSVLFVREDIREIMKALSMQQDCNLQHRVKAFDRYISSHPEIVVTLKPIVYCKESSVLNIARTKVRRLEVFYWKHNLNVVIPGISAYLNRLSLYLYYLMTVYQRLMNTELLDL